MEISLFALAPLALFLTSCGTPPNQPAREPGPDGTVIYKVPVNSSQPGARIEVNGDSVGETPMVLKIFGDRDGTFHNFGSYDFIVRAHPPDANRPSLTKVFHTGALMGQEDRIPPRIYFDFDSNTVSTNSPPNP